MNNSLGDALSSVMGRIQVGKAKPSACGVQDWILGEQEGCNGFLHLQAGGRLITRCPAKIAEEIQALVDPELERLEGAITRAFRGQPVGFDGFDPKRARGGGKALAAMVRFAGESRPSRGALLSGQTGIGKTRLMLASHFTRMRAGLPSEFVTVSDLRGAFADSSSFDADRRGPAEARLRRLRRCPAIHIDDLGIGEGSASFAAKFQQLLEDMPGAVAVSLNLASDEARKHPDIGERVLSRLIDNAEVARMEGEDQRVARAKK